MTDGKFQFLTDNVGVVFFMSLTWEMPSPIDPTVQMQGNRYRIDSKVEK